MVEPVLSSRPQIPVQENESDITEQVEKVVRGIYREHIFSAQGVHIQLEITQNYVPIAELDRYGDIRSIFAFNQIIRLR